MQTDGGLWVRQPSQQQQQQQQQPHHHHQDQHLSSSLDLAQHDRLDDHPDQHSHQRPQQPQLLTNVNSNTPNDLFVFVNPNLNSSSSDLATPLTPTFSSHNGNHLRYASSTSSLDLQQSFSACSDSPVSPPQPLQTQVQAQTQTQTQNIANASPIASASTKRLLPDVQEDPLEREDDDDDEPTMTRLTDEQLESLYDCLCMPAPALLNSSTPIRVC